MSSGNILTVTDVLNLLVSGIDKTTLETELTASGWISTPARGGSKSGAGPKLIRKTRKSCRYPLYSAPLTPLISDTMNLQEIWQQYDFTESEVLSMGWQFPYDYVLNLNYYWQLNPSDSTSEIATNDQFLNIILKTCIRLEVQLNPNPDELDRKPANLGTIVGWGAVTPSPWLENLSLSSNEWLHLLFEIGGNNKIEAVCRSIAIEQLAKQPLVLSS